MAGDEKRRDGFGWELNADADTVQLRLDSLRAAEMLEEFFHGVANPSASKFPVERISGIYEPHEATVLEDFLALLRKLIYDSPEAMVDREGNTVAKWLVEIVPDNILRDIILFTGRIHGVNAADELPTADRIVDFFDQLIHDILFVIDGSWSESWHSYFQSTSGKLALKHWRSELVRLRNKLSSGIVVAGAAQATEELLGDIEHARDAALRAAGQTGNLKLGEHFRLIAAREERAERNYTVGVFAALILTLLIGSSVVLEYSGGSADWKSTLFHLVLVLPAVGAASYASRIARHHRILARWAKTASVQVDSIDAFAQQLSSDDNKDALFLQLGHNVFGSPLLGDESKSEHYSAIPPEVVELLKDVAAKLTPGLSKS